MVDWWCRGGWLDGGLAGLPRPPSAPVPFPLAFSTRGEGEKAAVRGVEAGWVALTVVVPRWRCGFPNCYWLRCELREMLVESGHPWAT